MTRRERRTADVRRAANGEREPNGAPHPRFTELDLATLDTIVGGLLVNQGVEAGPLARVAAGMRVYLRATNGSIRHDSNLAHLVDTSSQPGHVQAHPEADHSTPPHVGESMPTYETATPTYATTTIESPRALCEEPPTHVPPYEAPSMGPRVVRETGQIVDVWLQTVSGDHPGLPSDPLLVDLDGDGIKLTSGVVDGVGFDINGDGQRDAVQWTTAGSDDAWLVHDDIHVQDDFHLGGKPGIGNGRELFGDQFGARSGFAALAELDGNADGVFNASDAAFEHVQLWRDVNHDGVSDPGELSSLADHGIVEINLTPRGQAEYDSSGNLMQQGSFVREVTR